MNYFVEPITMLPSSSTSDIVTTFISIPKSTEVSLNYITVVPSSTTTTTTSLITSSSIFLSLYSVTSSIPGINYE